jgi:hypothetical protein
MHAARRALLCVVGSWLAILAGLARAQEPSVTAEALFRAGRQASARGDHATACAKYRESYRIENALGTLLNIAVCEQALGELASAWQHYQHVLSALPSDDTRVALTRARLEEVERRLPRLTVVIREGDDATLRIVLGELELSPSSFDVPLPLDPGRHELRVLAAGHEPASYPFELVEGERRTLEVAPGPAFAPDARAFTTEIRRPLSLATTAPVPRDTAADGSVQRTAGVLALVTGGAALLTSAVSFGLAIERKLVVDEHCPRDACDPIGIAAARSGKDFVNVSLVSLAIGVAGGATGLYLLLTAPDRPTARVAAGPWLAESLIGARIEGSL